MSKGKRGAFGEPIDQNRHGDIVDCGGRTICAAVLPYSADRFIACVNSLDGVEDPAAELKRLRQIEHDYAALEEERNRLADIVDKFQTVEAMAIDMGHCFQVPHHHFAKACEAAAQADAGMKDAAR